MSALLVAAVLLVLTGCDQGAPRKPPMTASPRPVTDAPPYLCDLVPEQSFRGATGVSIPLDPQWVNGPQPDNGLCLAYPARDQAPLSVRWSYNNGPSTIRQVQRDWTGGDAQPHSLPREMGEGLAVIRPTAGADPRPNYVIAVFECGKRKPWISIDFARVVRGRDAIQDLMDFMRIAERRFGRIHKCTPRPL